MSTPMDKYKKKLEKIIRKIEAGGVLNSKETASINHILGLQKPIQFKKLQAELAAFDEEGKIKRAKPKASRKNKGKKSTGKAKTNPMAIVIALLLLFFSLAGLTILLLPSEGANSYDAAATAVSDALLDKESQEEMSCDGFLDFEKDGSLKEPYVILEEEPQELCFELETYEVFLNKEGSPKDDSSTIITGYEWFVQHLVYTGGWTTLLSEVEEALLLVKVVQREDGADLGSIVLPGTAGEEPATGDQQLSPESQLQTQPDWEPEQDEEAPEVPSTPVILIPDLPATPTVVDDVFEELAKPVEDVVPEGMTAEEYYAIWLAQQQQNNQQQNVIPSPTPSAADEAFEILAYPLLTPTPSAADEAFNELNQPVVEKPPGMSVYDWEILLEAMNR